MDKKSLLNLIKSISIEESIDFKRPGVLKEVVVEKNNLFLKICISNPSLQFKNKLKGEIEQQVLKKFPQALINIEFLIENLKSVDRMSSIQNIIAIASGKGGVGKSTISSNLAVALKNKGYKVGLVDADIYGPSIPLMFDAQNEKPKAVNNNNQSLMAPIISYGVKIMSIGFFSEPSSAVVWRGPMATKALKEIINQTDWGNLDYLLIDLPPGTGDIHLSLVQTLSITGAIIITTPQPVSLIDARKAINMFKKTEINIPIIGLVENMSSLLIDGKKHYIFGKDGGKVLSESEEIKLLAEIPLDQSVREAGDIGRPAVLQQSALANVFNDLAMQVENSINSRNSNLPPTKKVKITHNRGCN